MVVNPGAGAYFCTGASVTLTATGAPGGASYSWLRNGSLITGTTATLSAGQAGLYQVVATSGGVADTSAPVQVREVPPVIHVDGGISVSGNGASWSGALKTLNEALALVNNSACATEIWVKAGTYYPTTANGVATTSRDSSFRLTRNGIGIYGGFAGTETARTQRNAKVNKTTLSGDIGTIGDSTDNVYNVVTVNAAATTPAVTTPAVIDGFTIRDGNGDSGFPAPFINNKNQAGGVLIKALQGLSTYADVSNCVLRNNYGVYGGGLCTWASGNNARTFVTVSNTVFTANNAMYGGGAMPVAFPGGSTGTTTFQNCIFTGNNGAGTSITLDADGIVATLNTTVINCSFFNEDYTPLYNVQQSGGTSTLTVNNSIVWHSGGNYSLLYAGAGTTTFNYSNLGMPAAGTNINTDPSFANPADPDGLDDTWGTADDGLKLSFASTSINAGNNSLVAATNTLDVTGSQRILQSTVDLGAYEGPGLVCPGSSRLYVNGSVAASGSGTSWGTALKTVWEALTIANYCSGVSEIWVGQGTYYPMVNMLTKASSRDSSFRIVRNGIKIYGGFAGTETTLSARNVTANPTILSGDIGTVGNSSDNSWHVMTVVGGVTGPIDSSTRVDGFTLRDGNANMAYGTTVFGISSVTSDGGGIAIIGSGAGNNCSPAIANCTLEQNYANVGGGAYCGAYNGGGTSPYFFNCIVRNNRSADVAGIHAFTGNISGGTVLPRIYNTQFINNTATGGGGAIGCFNGGLNGNGPYLESCVFSGNTAGGSGGVFNTYTGNCSMTAINCVFVGNSSTGTGGALNLGGGGTYTLTNCTFSNNTSTNSPASNAIQNNGTLNLRNSIVWGSAATQVQNGGTITYNYSNVRGITPPANSLSLDPLFVNAADPDGADNIWGTADDGLQLQICSPAIGAGSNALLPASITVDFAGATRVQQTVVDMGAYESAHVNSYAVLSTLTKTDPTTCGGTDGAIALGSLVPARIYTVNYSRNGVPQPSVTITASATGQVSISGLNAGTYNAFSVTFNGCTTPAFAGTATLTDPPVPVISGTTSQNPSVCGLADGSISLTGTFTGVSATVTYSRNGTPVGPLSAVISGGAIVISGLTAGSYTNIVVTTTGCSSNTIAGPVVLTEPTPAISSVTGSDPTTCGGTDGSITVNGLSAGLIYTINYSLNGVSQSPVTATASTGGSITLSGLGAGSYSGFTASISGCTSSAFVGPVVLRSPLAPPTPTPTSNTPVCSGATLSLSAGTSIPGASYAWTGPGGFSSTLHFPSIPATTTAMSGSYQLVVTVANCSSAAGSVTVVINETPAGVTAGSNTPVCESGTISLTGSSITPGVSYNWTGPGGYSSTVQNPTRSSAAASMSGTYTLQVVNASGTCTTAVSTPVLVRPTPVIAGVTGSNPLTCNGSDGSIQISGLAPGTAYSVAYLNGTTPQTASASSDATGVVTLSGLARGTYSGFIVSLNGCASASFAGPVTLSDPPVPAAPTASSNTPVCQGAALNLSASGLPGASFSWTGPGSFSSSSASPSIPAITPANAGSYSVTQTVAGCVSAPASTVVSVIALPAQPGTISGPAAPCVGTTAAYSVSPVATATSYVWTFPDATWTGSSTSANVTATTGTASGTISVSAVNGCGAGPASVLSVIANTAPAQAAAINGPLTVCNGVAATYTSGTVSNATSYSWILPSGWSGSSTSASISATAGASGGTIYVMPRNACGAGPSQSLNVNVTTIPARPGTISGITAPCVGTTQTYFVTPVSGATGYTWSYPSGGSPAWGSSGGGSLVNVSVGTASGNISVTANNACGSSQPATLTITVKQLPAAAGAITGNTAPCTGSTTSYGISPVADAISYNWNIPATWSGSSSGASIALLAGTGSGTISVTPVGICGNGPASSIAVSGTPVVTPSVTLTHSTPSDTICAGTPVTFTATATNAGSNPVFTFRRNGTVLVSSGASSYTIAGLSSNDRISVTMTSSLPCVSRNNVSDSIRMIVIPVRTPGININTQPPTALCEGQTVTLRTNDTNGGSNPIYEWYLNGTVLSGVTAANYTPSTVNNGDTFQVFMTTDIQCAKFMVAVSNKIGFSVTPVVMPSVSVAATPAGPVPAGTVITFTATQSNGGSKPVYQWLRNGVEVAGASGDTWSTGSLSSGDVISLRMLSDAPCASPEVVLSNTVQVSIGSTGIRQSASIRAVRLYPNPTTGRFTVEVDGVTPAPGMRSAIDVLNAVGQRVYHMEFLPDRASWSHDVRLEDALANGTYMLRVSTEGSGFSTIPFFLNR